MLAETIVDKRRAHTALRWLRTCLIRHGHANSQTPVVRYYCRDGITAKLQLLDIHSPEQVIKEVEFPAAEYYNNVSAKLIELVGTTDVVLVRHYQPNFVHSGWKRLTSNLTPWRPAGSLNGMWQQLYKPVV